MITRAFFNKKPLPSNFLSPLPLGAIQPDGWLGSKLTLQAEYLATHLDNVLPGWDSASSWLGGSLNDGDSAPEALASLCPIAYVTGNEKLKSVVNRFVDWCIASQQKNGDYGPQGMTQWWPKVLMLRVLKAYFLSTGNKEVLKLMDRFFHYQHDSLDTLPLTGKACSRAAENMLAVLWMYNITEQKYLLELCTKLNIQSLDWTDEMHIFPHIRDTVRQRPLKTMLEGLELEGELNGLSQRVNGREYYLTNAVDVASGLKAPGVVNLFKSGIKEPTAFRVGWTKYMKQHGVALGMFTGDDHLAGTDPSRGINLAAVAEAVNSFNVMLGTDPEFNMQAADLFEKLALNVPGAVWKKDMSAREAMLAVNQLNHETGNHGAYNAPQDAFCLQERPLDLGDQILAAYDAGLWFATNDGGLSAVSYAPCTVHYVAGGERVRVTVKSDYPYSGKVCIRVETRETADFPIYLRIPSWTSQAIIQLPDGSMLQMHGGEVACAGSRWTGDASIMMDLTMEPRLLQLPHQSVAVEYGPLLMALDLDEDQGGWNWALDDKQPMKALQENGKCQVLVKAAKAAQWFRKGHDCGPMPVAPIADSEESVLRLTDFASTSVRIAQFPKLGE